MTAKATVRLTAWELVAIEEALARFAFSGIEPCSLKALQEKIANAVIKDRRKAAQAALDDFNYVGSRHHY